jgi:hypothetical protein
MAPCDFILFPELKENLEWPKIDVETNTALLSIYWPFQNLSFRVASIFGKNGGRNMYML